MNKLNNFFLQIFFYFLFFATLVAVHLAVIKALPYPFNKINFLIIFIIFILFVFGKRLAMFASLIIGLILDFYYFPSLGINTVSLLLTLLLTNFLLVNFLTDKSLYSFLALTSTAYFSFIASLHIFYYVVSLGGGLEANFVFNRYFFNSKIYGWLFSLIIATIIFYIFNYINKRYKPFFLIKGGR
ncbi:MAG: hypothetical protein BWY51_00094 [Parcubacteria group bacterium ADurb.Bin316]|nr:MAG: hypothetical protein BWY51_00094 [Parcubacteria group bacterium ADurb.Bin316]HOZ56244.1 hypothetical protein [bacterium]